VSSAYPDWKRPTSGLSPSERHTACTSENLLLAGRRPRNGSLSLRAAEDEQAYRGCAQDTIENRARNRRTISNIGLDRARERVALGAQHPLALL